MALMQPESTINTMVKYCDIQHITMIIICDQQYMPDKVHKSCALQNVLIISCADEKLCDFIDTLSYTPIIIFWGQIVGSCKKYTSSAIQISSIIELPDINISSPVHTQKTLNWMYRAHCLIYTDGGCQKNGSPNAVGSFAATLFNSQLGQIVVHGRVRPAIYTFDDDVLRQTSTFAAATNNRAEYLAVIQALLAAREINVCGSIDIISDCKNAVQTINEWYPKWILCGTLDKVANIDLVKIMCNLFQSFSGRCTITHTYAHKKPPPESASAVEKRNHTGNKYVDALATLALRFPPRAIQLINAPYPVRKIMHDQLDL
jgi:ribonuclease HI